MNRRSFLKLTGAVLASAVLPLPNSKAVKEFDPTQIYYGYVYITDWCKECVKVAKELLVKQIRLSVPAEYCNKKYIKFVYHEPGICGTGFIDPMNQRGSVAWKYIPEGKQKVA